MQGTMGGQRLTLHSCPVPQRRRPFQCVARKQLTPKESRIGKVPIVLPAGVSVKIDGQHITVKARPHPPLALEPSPDALFARWLIYIMFICFTPRQRACDQQGPRGELAHSVDTLLDIQQAEDGSVRLSKRAESRRANEQHGLWRYIGSCTPGLRLRTRAAGQASQKFADVLRWFTACVPACASCAGSASVADRGRGALAVCPRRCARKLLLCRLRADTLGPATSPTVCPQICIVCMAHRTLTANLVEGTSTGFSKQLTLIGVGYRAQVLPRPSSPACEPQLSQPLPSEPSPGRVHCEA